MSKRSRAKHAPLKKIRHQRVSKAVRLAQRVAEVEDLYAKRLSAWHAAGEPTGTRALLTGKQRRVLLPGGGAKHRVKHQPHHWSKNDIAAISRLEEILALVCTEIANHSSLDAAHTVPASIEFLGGDSPFVAHGLVADVAQGAIGAEWWSFNYHGGCAELLVGAPHDEFPTVVGQCRLTARIEIAAADLGHLSDIEAVSVLAQLFLALCTVVD